MAEYKHWSRITESGTLLGMNLLLLIYRCTGRIGFQAVLYPVMIYYYLTRANARRASQEYLARLQRFFPDIKVQSSFKHFLMFGEVLLDKLLAWMGRIQMRDIKIHSDGAFEQALHDKQGGIIVVSHLGNTEVSNALAHQQPDLKLTLLVFTQHAEKFNSLIQNVTRKTHIEMVQVTDMSPAFIMLMSERVANGEFLVIAGDRTPVTGQRRVSEVSFLGASAVLPQGAFILASLLECPVYLLFCLKQKKQYQLFMELFSSRLKWPRKQREAGLQQSVQAYAKRLEHYCAKAPMQWFNFYSFWRNAETDHAEHKV